jgi:hypothetical protein
MNIKVILRDGGEVKIPSNGESAKSWLASVRRSGDRTIPVGTTSFRVKDIMDAVDERPRVRQTNLEGI